MMLKTLIKESQYYTTFNYRPPRPQNKVKSQDIMIVAGTGVNLATIFFSQGTVRIKFGRKSPQMRFSWIIWKHHWPPQCIRLVVTWAGPLWRSSSNPEHKQFLATRYIFWMDQVHQLQFQVNMRIFNSAFRICIGGKKIR